jgi:hypothetical protein
MIDFRQLTEQCGSLVLVMDMVNDSVTSRELSCRLSAAEDDEVSPKKLIPMFFFF